MKITSAEFLRGVVGSDELLDEGVPQVALVGRSNVGKSSIINSLTARKNLARASDTPGRTQEINIYSINNRSIYLLDLPGYGYAKVPRVVEEKLQKLLFWYLYDSPYMQKKVFLVIDAKVGPTHDDIDVLNALREHHKNIVVVANKIDKIKKSEYVAQMQKITGLIGDEKIIPYSADEKIGVNDLLQEL